MLAQRQRSGFIVQFSSNFPAGRTVFKKDVKLVCVHWQDTNFTGAGHAGADERATCKYLSLHAYPCVVVEG